MENTISRPTAGWNKTKWLHRSVSFFRFVFLLGMSYVMLYPILFMLSSGFKSLNDVFDPTVAWLPHEYSLQPIKLAADVMDFWHAFGKTLMMTVPSVLLQLLSTLLAGYGFARFKFRGSKILFGILIFSIIVPTQSYIIPLYVNLSNFDFFGIGSLIGLFTGSTVGVNMLDTDAIFWLMAFLGAGIRSGLYIFIVRQFFRNIPSELEDAAEIDGCGPLMTFWRIMLPNASSLLATVSVFSVVWYWNDYFISSMFYKSSFPLSVNLTNLHSLLTTSDMVTGISSQELIFMKEPIIACGCLITILPLIFFYLFAQRYFTEGLERSGVVG